MSRNWQVPVDKETGNPVRAVYRWMKAENYDWRDPWTFTDRLIITDYSRNNSTTNIHLTSENGTEYVASDTLLYQALREGRVDGNSITGTFTFKKKGSYVLLDLLPVNEAAELQNSEVVV